MLLPSCPPPLPLSSTGRRAGIGWAPPGSRPAAPPAAWPASDRPAPTPSSAAGRHRPRHQSTTGLLPASDGRRPWELGREGPYPAGGGQQRADGQAGGRGGRGPAQAAHAWVRRQDGQAARKGGGGAIAAAAVGGGGGQQSSQGQVVLLLLLVPLLALPPAPMWMTTDSCCGIHEAPRHHKTDRQEGRAPQDQPTD